VWKISQFFHLFGTSIKIVRDQEIWKTGTDIDDGKNPQKDK